MKKIGIVRFLGTNCDRDIWQAVETVGAQPEWLWFKDRFDIKSFDAIIIPGGFSYGDYIRAGALAAKSKVMTSVVEAANSGVPILGICNGFQILCETGLLPGCLTKNHSLNFIDRWEKILISNVNPYWAGNIKKANLPIAHGEGCYFSSEDEFKKTLDNDQVWLKYHTNPNGSLMDVAGVTNLKKNVAGLMPHPERAMSAWMGSDDGKVFFESILN